MTEQDKDTVVTVDEGKYTFIIRKNAVIEILRHGEPWIEEWDYPGINALIAMILELEEARDTIREVQDIAKSWIIYDGPEGLDEWTKSALAQDIGRILNRFTQPLGGK